jgi:hypothetical protein
MSYVDTLRTHVEGIKLDPTFDGIQSFIEYIPLASRLVALAPCPEHQELFARWDECNLVALQLAIVERAKEGMWDLRHALSDDLAGAMVDAQGWYCWWSRVKDKDWPDCLRTNLEAWFEMADEDVLLDEEATTSLEMYREREPLSDEDTLVQVAAPMSQSMLMIMAQIVQHQRKTRPTTLAYWEPPTVE